MNDDDLSGGGPTGRFHPDTSREAGEHDHAAQRKIIIEIIYGRPFTARPGGGGVRPLGANAYEVWSIWRRSPDPEWRMHLPTSENNVNNRMADLAPNTPAKVNDPGKKRITYTDEHGDPYLWWTEERRPTGTRSGKGHVYVPFRYRHSLGARQDTPGPQSDTGATAGGHVPGDVPLEDVPVHAQRRIVRGHPRSA
jgi:hypothetical protein